MFEVMITIIFVMIGLKTLYPEYSAIDAIGADGYVIVIGELVTNEAMTL